MQEDQAIIRPQHLVAPRQEPVRSVPGSLGSRAARMQASVPSTSTRQRAPDIVTDEYGEDGDMNPMPPPQPASDNRPYEKWSEQDKAFLLPFARPIRLKEAMQAYNAMRAVGGMKARNQRAPTSPTERQHSFKTACAGREVAAGAGCYQNPVVASEGRDNGQQEAGGRTARCSDAEDHTP
ncbi:MAG: hypothetical protein J3Q66DRAFT_398157 [Benniella sp.]|nr:MAG: hypothetical protein J3Q66DRAFT_398157 [Benniella sp.]